MQDSPGRTVRPPTAAAPGAPPLGPVPGGAVQARAGRRVVSTYSDLAAQVREAGLLGRRRGWYWRRTTVVLLALAGLAALSARTGDSWWQLALAPLVALVVTQIAFLGHDAAHQQVFSSPRWNEAAARFLAAGLAGLSYGWWLGKHNAHHAAPNQRGRDGDIESKVLAFYPEAADGRSRPRTWLLRHQGLWLFPLLLLEGFNLHVDSLAAVLRRGPVRGRRVDVALLGAHWTAYLLLANLVMSPGRAAAFVAVDLACLGVFLGGAFVPNHTGMPVLENGVKLDFLHRQVAASRNVRGGLLVDVAMGGLNRQVEHHLFPSMPRPNLRLVQPMVRAHCAQHGIPYTEASFGGAFAAVVRYLDTVGLAARRRNSCPLAAQLRA